MKKMTFKNWSIKNKLLLYFILIAIASILAAGIIINALFSNALENASYESTKVAIGQINNSIDYSILNYENIIDVIGRNTQVIRYMRGNSGQSASEEWGLLEANIKSLIDDFQYKYYGIEGIAIIGHDGSFISNELSPVQQELLVNESWYTESIAKTEKLNIFGDMGTRNIKRTEQISTNDYFTITKAIKDPATNWPMGVIVVDLNIKLLENLVKSTRIGKNGFVYIIDSQDKIIYSPNEKVTCRVKQEWFGDDRTFIKILKGAPYQFIFTSSFYTEWKIVGVLYQSETIAEVLKLRLYLLYILIGICLLAIPASIMLSSNIAKPIKKLQMLMKQAEQGTLDVRFNAKSQDEIGQLGNSFNKMLIEIKELMNEIYKEQRSKRKAELRILQSQIKPHFLYNTLDTIHWMCKKYEAKDIIEIVNALTKLFRLALSKGKETISLKEELEHVGSYLIIQKERYEDLISYEIIENEQIGSLMVQKLILQPLVENAIYHGLKIKKDKGRITVSSEIENDVLLLKVEDNGIGIEEEKLKELNEMLQSQRDRQDGYGIFNVNDRIKLTYGDKYGLDLYSKYGAGTIAVIKHPIIEEGAIHVKSFNRG